MSLLDTPHQLFITTQLQQHFCPALPLHMICYFSPWVSDATVPIYGATTASSSPLFTLTLHLCDIYFAHLYMLFTSMLLHWLHHHRRALSS